MTAMIIIDPALHVSAVPATYVAPANLQNFGVAATPGSTTGTLAGGNISTYTGDTYTVTPANCVLNSTADILSGYFTGTGALAVIPVGFVPTRVKAINWTDGITYEWAFGAPATDTIKNTTSADNAVDTGTAILVTADASGGNGSVTFVTLSATLCVNAKVISFRIEA